MNAKNGNKNEIISSRGDRKASQGYVNIRDMSLQQLDELIRRQNKLLQNRYFLEKLPDKGKKILLFKTTLEIEQKKKQQEYEITCQLLSNLSLQDKNTDEMEWNRGQLIVGEKELSNDKNEDDELKEKEENPLKLMATHSGTASGENCKINSCESEVIKKNVNEVKKIWYVDKFCQKYENRGKFKERFQPNQLKNNDKTLFVISAEKVKKRLGNKWEVTQATPPVPTYENTKMISLIESLKLQKEQVEKIKEMEKKYATEKLLHSMSVKMGNELPLNDTTNYRNIQNFFDESANEEENELTDSDG